MSLVLKKKLEVDRRTIVQNATLAIRDIYDAIVELVTNADDRYQVLGKKGRVEIEVRRRKGKPSLLMVRDFADGMTGQVMELKLSRIGGRVSGMERGLAVRGTNSRGAKDVAALGKVTFESIACDGRLHTCRITEHFDFELDSSHSVSKRDRERLRIGRGTGTVVTISINANHRVPIHKELVKKVASLVPLRDIIYQKGTKILVRDLQQCREDQIRLPPYGGHKRLADRFSVPGYHGVEAKLLIYRASKPFKRDKPRFRLGGILVKSKHAIHEATLFDSELERDPCAARFYGRLTCEAIDDLWNDFDERQSKKMDLLESNPRPVLDPSRKAGLTRGHPFVSGLFKEALKRLRPLVEEERRLEQNERTKVESQETRKRLNALEKATNKFIEEYSDEEDVSRGHSRREKGSRFRIRGYSLSPPFAQMVVGHSRKCWMSIVQEAFPEIAAGDPVQIKPLTHELRIDSAFATLKSNPTREGVLQAKWSIKALEKTEATGLRAQVGPIDGEIMIEILGSEAEKYSDIGALQFQKNRYRIRPDSRKRVKLLAPLSIVESSGTKFEVKMQGSGYYVKGSRYLVKKPSLGVATAVLTVSVSHEGLAPGKLYARLRDHEAETEIVIAPSTGVGIEIRLEDVTYGVQRYRWKQNVLEIAARHPSLSRYLGPKSKQFPGQEERHFRVLLAEIVAEAVCSQVLRHNILANPADYENADWDDYYSSFLELMNRFLPIAHELVVPETK